MTTKRIGFACKWIDTPAQVNGIGPNDDAKKYNVGGTTVSWLNRQTRQVAEQKLWDLMHSNIESVRKLVEKVSTLDEHLRMVRIGSDVLTAYTHPDWVSFWRQSDVQQAAERAFCQVGDLARKNNVRLSMHPGQFVVLASDNPDIVNRSIEEFEYHADMARWMGYGKSFQDFKINVHISGRAGPEGIRQAYTRLSPEARNCITIENEEMSYGLDDCLSLADVVPIVLDIHHHWCKTGEYVSPLDPRVKRVVDSWRGVRPTCHYSVSREDCLVGHTRDVMPEMEQLLAAGYKKQKLRAHSDFFWNHEVNAWAAQFSDQFDIMCEAKGKNLASFEFAKSVGEMPNISHEDYQDSYNPLISQSTKVSQVRDNLDLYLYANRIYLLVKDHAEVLGNLNVSPVSIAQKEYLNIDGIFVDPKYRKTSATHWLIYSVKEVVDKPVVADGAIFKGGQDLIAAVRKHKYLNVSVIDLHTGRTSELGDTQINSPDHAYVFESANLGFGKVVFEGTNLPYVWYPLFEEVVA